MTQGTEPRIITVDGFELIVPRCVQCPMNLKLTFPSDRFDDEGYPEDPEVMYACNHPKGPDRWLEVEDKASDFPEKCPLKRNSAVPPKTKRAKKA